MTYIYVIGSECVNKYIQLIELSLLCTGEIYLIMDKIEYSIVIHRVFKVLDSYPWSNQLLSSEIKTNLKNSSLEDTKIFIFKNYINNITVQRYTPQI